MGNTCFFRIRKMKDARTISDAYSHNMRLFDVANADPARSDMNRSLVFTPGCDYNTAFDQAISDLRAEGISVPKVRSDAVRELECVMTFSGDREDIDIDEWCRVNMEWLDEEFNPPGHEIRYTDKDGEEHTAKVQNIKFADLHMDETTPHIHAVIVPINKEGRLSARSYLGGLDTGSRVLSGMQDRYAAVMNEHFGLERGQKKSTATHEELSRYHSYIKQAVNAQLPAPGKGMTAEEYHAAANEAYRAALSVHHDEMAKKDQELVRERTAARQAREETSRLSARLDEVADAIGAADIGDMEIERLRLMEEERRKRERARAYDRERYEALTREMDALAGEDSRNVPGGDSRYDN